MTRTLELAYLLFVLAAFVLLVAMIA